VSKSLDALAAMRAEGALADTVFPPSAAPTAARSRHFGV